ncbi:hypothetical protein H0H93_006954, partial [Arthromyces matolae]
MRIITIFPAILVLGTWFSTSTQAVPLTDLDAKNLLARKILPQEDTKSAHTREEDTLHAIHLQSQMVQLRIAAQQLRVHPALAG